MTDRLWLWLADRIVPPHAVWPPRLTLGDYPLGFIYVPRPLSHREVEELKARWLALQPTKRRTP